MLKYMRLTSSNSMFNIAETMMFSIFLTYLDKFSVSCIVSCNVSLISFNKLFRKRHFFAMMITTE